MLTSGKIDVCSVLHIPLALAPTPRWVVLYTDSLSRPWLMFGIYSAHLLVLVRTAGYRWQLPSAIVTDMYEGLGESAIWKILTGRTHDNSND